MAISFIESLVMSTRTVCVLGLAGCFSVGCSDQFVSFYYEIEVENDTTFEFLAVSLVQLTDVMDRGRHIKVETEIIPKQKTRTIRLPGELDSDETLLLIVAQPSTQSGSPTEMPAENLALKMLSFETISRFAGRGGEDFPEIYSLTLRDEDFSSLDAFKKTLGGTIENVLPILGETSASETANVPL